MSKLTTTAKESLHNESKMDCLASPLYSAISKHSSMMGMPKDIKAWLMLFQGDSHASHSQSKEKEKPAKTKEICGLPLAKLSTSSDHLTPFWKMSQVLLVVDISETFYQTWRKSGMMQDGVVYPLRIAALHTKGKGYGLLPTPRASQDYKPIRKECPVERKGTHGRSLSAAVGKLVPEKVGYYLNPTLLEKLMDWPIGWTGLKPLETAKFLKWLQPHGEF